MSVLLSILPWVFVTIGVIILCALLFEAYNRDDLTVVVNVLFICQHEDGKVRIRNRTERFSKPLTLTELKDWAVKVAPWYFSDKIEGQGVGKILKVMVNDDESPLDDYLLNNGDYVEFVCA